MHPIRIGIAALITGVLILSLVYASIPYSDWVPPQTIVEIRPDGLPAKVRGWSL